MDAIFDGYVQSSMRTLELSIECCEKWKTIYDKTAVLHHKFSQTGWLLDKSSIFAQVDAFVQRCRDLLEVGTGTEIHPTSDNAQLEIYKS